MKIYFKPEGGFGYFPGLNKPLELNSEKLPIDEANHLKQLVSDASFFNLPNQEPVASRGADQKKYTIRVEEKDRQHWVEFHDAEVNPRLHNLVNYLSKKQKETRS